MPRSGSPRHALLLSLLPLAPLMSPVQAVAACPDPPPACSTCQPLILHRQGEPAPGTADAFQSFDRPNVAASGVVAFTANTDGPVDADDVLYVGAELVAREGDPAPGLDGVSLGPPETFQSSHHVNASGGVVYLASLLDQPSSADLALFRDQTLIARAGDPAPGIDGRTLVDLAYPGLTDDGVVGLLVDLDGSSADDSVVYLDGTPIYREGDPVPGLADVTWDGNFDELQWNGRGDLLFEGNTSLPASGDRVVFRRMHQSGQIVEQIVAREGDPVSGPDGTAALGQIQQTALASDGRWAIRGTLADTPAESSGIVIAEGGFVRREGEPVPELPGVVLGNFTGVAINAHGDVLYLADLEGATPAGVDEGLFVNCCLLLTDGMAVPDLPEGTTFSDIGFEDAQLDDTRRVVFQASYAGTLGGDGIFVLDCATCAGDLDGDGSVDVDDLVTMLLDWGASGASIADLDDDGDVDVDDLAMLLLAWGPCGDGG